MNDSKMRAANSVTTDADYLDDLKSGAQVLDWLEDRVRSVGATRFLATGIPLPGRPLAPLVLRASWGEGRDDRPNSLNIPQVASILEAALRIRRPFTWPLLDHDPTSDPALVGPGGPPSEAPLLVMPITAFPPYQGCVVAAGPGLAHDVSATLVLDYFCTEAFARLLALKAIRKERPGDLSARERRVLELSASGKTANDIANLLRISQRTVHAHLQNASDKLHASNKTHTVIEALRYSQIEI